MSQSRDGPYPKSQAGSWSQLEELAEVNCWLLYLLSAGWCCSVSACRVGPHLKLQAERLESVRGVV